MTDKIGTLTPHYARLSWRKVQIVIGQPKQRNSAQGITRDIIGYDWPVRLSYQGRAATFTIRGGSLWTPTGPRVIGHLACFTSYAFEDGDPDKLVPFGPADTTAYPLQDDWCGATDHDADDPASRVAYAHWVRDAFLVAHVLGNLLQDAMEVDE